MIFTKNYVIIHIDKGLAPTELPFCAAIFFFNKIFYKIYCQEETEMLGFLKKCSHWTFNFEIIN